MISASCNMVFSGPKPASLLLKATHLPVPASSTSSGLRESRATEFLPSMLRVSPVLPIVYLIHTLLRYACILGLARFISKGGVNGFIEVATNGFAGALDGEARLVTLGVYTRRAEAVWYMNAGQKRLGGLDGIVTGRCVGGGASDTLRHCLEMA